MINAQKNLLQIKYLLCFTSFILLSGIKNKKVKNKRIEKTVTNRGNRGIETNFKIIIKSIKENKCVK